MSGNPISVHYPQFAYDKRYITGRWNLPWIKGKGENQENNCMSPKTHATVAYLLVSLLCQ